MQKFYLFVTIKKAHKVQYQFLLPLKKL